MRKNCVASSCPRKRNCPALKSTREAHSPMTFKCRGSRPCRKGCAAKTGSSVSMPLLLCRRRGSQFTLPDGPDFFSDINGHREPGDAAAAAHAPQNPDLVHPGGQFVG